MEAPALEKITTWFKSHTDAYLCGDPRYDRNIQLKQAHSARVCENILYLGHALGLPPADLNLAAAAAWLHDLGRFEQYRRYQTFNDRQSVNHARLSVQEAVRHKVLAHCTPQARRLILLAVIWHNAARLPVSVTNRARLFMQLLRDADKLDIWKVVLDYYNRSHREPNHTIELDLPDSPDVSPQVLKAFSRQTFVNTSAITTLNDFKLLQVSWVFDLNFTASFKRVQECQFIERLAATLPATPEVTAAVAVAQQFLFQKLAE